MRLRTAEKIQFSSEYSTLVFLIIPTIIFGINFSLDFFLPRLFITFYPGHSDLNPLLLNSSFIGSFITALWAFLYYRTRPDQDNPVHYKNLLIGSLVISGVGILFLSASWYSGWLVFIIIGRILIGSGFTLLNVVTFPIILGTQDDKLRAFWFFFVTGFSAFGRFFAYPSSYFFFNSKKDSLYQPLIISSYYIIIALIIFCIILFGLKMPLKIGIFFKTSSSENSGAPRISYEVITGLVGLALMGFYEFYITQKNNFMWFRYGSDPNLFTLITGLAIMSGGYMLGRFGTSIKLAALPPRVKNLMLVLITASMVFFISLIITMMNVSLNDILLNLLISVIFILILIISRNHVFSIFTGVSLGGFILTFITMYFLKGTDFENTALVSGGVFRAMSWPTLVYLTLYNYKHSLLSMSGLTAVAINSRFVFYLPEYIFNYSPAFLEEAGYYIMLFTYLYFIWVGINQQIRKEELNSGNFLFKN